MNPTKSQGSEHECTAMEAGDAVSDGLKLSVVIACLNEEKVIGRCLDSLIRQDFPPDAFEVIVVDNGSTDGTLEVVRSYSAFLHLTILSKTGAHISALRNLGAALARGEFLAFLDADCLPPPTWLSQAMALLATNPYGVIGAHYSIPTNSSWVAKAWNAYEVRNNTRKCPWVPAGDLIVKKSEFSNLGRFDETLETNEDYDFCKRANRAGITVRAMPAIAVVHLGAPQTLCAFYRKQRWHGKDVLRVFLRNVPAFYNVRPLLFSFYMLLCLVGSGVGIITGAISNQFEAMWFFMAATIVAPFLLSLRFAISRNRWADVASLTLLFLIFGIARALCILDLRSGPGVKKFSKAGCSIGLR